MNMSAGSELARNEAQEAARATSGLKPGARPWNFSAGPSALPLEVLEQAASEVTDWQGSGISGSEILHRGKQFTRIYEETIAGVRERRAVTEHFEILLMQGGATAQNAIIPLILIGRNGAGKADYVVTGIWS